MTTDKRGVSALLLQRQLGLSRYETVWMMLHKLRRAMVNTARERYAATWRLMTHGLAANKRAFAVVGSSRIGEPPSSWWQWRSAVGLPVALA